MNSWRMSRILRHWSIKYDVAVGSVGRWKAETILPDGTPDPEEFRIACGLIEAAARLGSPVYVCGCNYVPALILLRELHGGHPSAGKTDCARQKARHHDCHLQLPQGNLHSQHDSLDPDSRSPERSHHQVRPLAQHLCRCGLSEGNERMGQPLLARAPEGIPHAQRRTG